MEDFILESELKIEARAGKPGRVSIMAYGGGIMNVSGFGPVVIDLQGLRMPATVPLLTDHDESIASAVGAGRPEILMGKLHITGQLAAGTDGGKHLLALHASGMQLQASVGVRPEKAERVRAGETVTVNGQRIKAPSTGMQIVRSGDLKEVSIVTLGADDTTSVTIAAKGHHMPEANTADILKAERERVAEIEKICAGSFGEYDNHMRDLKAKALSEEIGVDTLRAAALDCLRSARPQPPTGPNRSFSDSGALTARHIEAALLCAHGQVELAAKHFGEQIVEGVKLHRLNNIPAVMKAALSIRGQEVPESEAGLIRAAWSTQLLVDSLNNSMNKALDQFYREIQATWRSFARERTVSDFHEHKSIRPSFVGELQQVASDGELKHATLDEAVFTFRVDTFGRMFSVSRQDLKNDHLGVFDQVIPMMAEAAMRSRSDNIWQTILGAGSHFSSGNGNLGESGSALDLASLEAGIVAMRTQRDDQGNDLDIRPAVLVVPPELEKTARAILESLEINNSVGPSGNALKGAVKLEVESRLSNTTKFSNASLTQWYLFGAPQTNPVTAAVLDETASPVTETKEADFNKLGLQMRVFQDYGSAMGDYRAAYKATGAAGGGG